MVAFQYVGYHNGRGSAYKNKWTHCIGTLRRHTSPPFFLPPLQSLKTEASAPWTLGPSWIQASTFIDLARQLCSYGGFASTNVVVCFAKVTSVKLRPNFGTGRDGNIHRDSTPIPPSRGKCDTGRRNVEIMPCTCATDNGGIAGHNTLYEHKNGAKSWKGFVNTSGQVSFVYSKDTSTSSFSLKVNVV